MTLRAVRGGFSLGPARALAIGRDDDAPGAREVLEDDAWETLQAPPEIRDPGHPVRVLTASLDATPAPLGTLRVRARDGALVLRTVDVDAPDGPRAIPDAIDAAFAALFDRVEAEGIDTLALRPAGSIVGRGEHAAARLARTAALFASAPGGLVRVYLRVTAAERAALDALD